MSGEIKGYREARERLEKSMRESGMDSKTARQRAVETANRNDRRAREGDNKRRT